MRHYQPPEEGIDTMTNPDIDRLADSARRLTALQRQTTEAKAKENLDKERRLIESSTKKADDLVAAAQKTLPPIGVAAPALVPPAPEAAAAPKPEGAEAASRGTASPSGREEGQ